MHGHNAHKNPHVKCKKFQETVETLKKKICCANNMCFLDNVETFWCLSKALETISIADMLYEFVRNNAYSKWFNWSSFGFHKYHRQLPHYADGILSSPVTGQKFLIVHLTDSCPRWTSHRNFIRRNILLWVFMGVNSVPTGDSL